MTTTITIPDTEYIEIRRDGVYVTTVQNGSLLPWFKQEVIFPFEEALTHKIGYSIHPVEERFEVYYEIEEDGKRHHITLSTKATLLAAKRAYMKFGRYTGAVNPSIVEYGFNRQYRFNGQWVNA